GVWHRAERSAADEDAAGRRTPRRAVRTRGTATCRVPEDRRVDEVVGPAVDVDPTGSRIARVTGPAAAHSQVPRDRRALDSDAADVVEAGSDSRAARIGQRRWWDLSADARVPTARAAA